VGQTTLKSGKSEFLSTHEVATITKRARRKAQCRVLDLMRVTYWIHPDGTPVVPRAQFRHTDGRMVAVEVEPDWEAIHGRKSAQ